MRINSINTNNNRSINVKGLSSKLSKQVYTKEAIKSLVDEYEEKSHGIVGTLPTDWIKKIPFDSRKQIIPNVARTLGEIFSSLRSCSTSNDLMKVNNTTTKILTDAGILGGKEETSLERVGQGSFGEVFKLSVNDKDYAIKVFRHLGNSSHTADSINGNLYEQAMGMYLRHKIPKRNHNIINMFYGDLKNGVMMSSFESNKTEFEGVPFNFSRIGLVHRDVADFSIGHNIVARKIVDIGSLMPIFDCKDALKHASFLNKMLITKDRKSVANFAQKVVEEKSSPNRNGKMMALIALADKIGLDLNDFYSKSMKTMETPVAIFATSNINRVSSKDVRSAFFEEMLSRNVEDIDILLAKNIDPPAQCSFMKRKENSNWEYFDELASRNSIKVNEELSKCGVFRECPENINTKLETLYANSNQFIRENIAKNIVFTPKENQREWIEKLAQHKDPRLISRLFYEGLLDDKIGGYVDRTIEVFYDNNDEYYIPKIISHLPGTLTRKWFQKFYEMNNEKYNEVLRNNLDKFSYSDRLPWIEKLGDIL